MRTFVPSLAVLAALAPALSSETFTVCPVPGLGDFTSPAAALASPLVTAGDVVRVLPGVYAGTLVVDKAVTLVSRAGPALTVLDGAGSGPVVRITAGATVRGFSITGAGGPVSAGGVRIESSSTAFLEDNWIFDNHPEGDLGIPCGGVLVDSLASAVIRGNDIRSNTSYSVGALAAGPFSSVDLIGNTIRGNGGPHPGGMATTITGGILFGGSGRFVNNVITGNHGTGIGAMFFGGGIPSPAGTSLEIVHCTIYGNTGGPIGSVGGIYFDDGGAVTIRNSLIHSNTGSVGMDMAFSPDFTSPPVLGSVDLDWSLVEFPAPGVLLGAHMLLPFVPPLLKAPAEADLFAPTTAGLFRPLPDSPLIDAGDSLAFPSDLEPVDRNGHRRRSGAAADIGAFELAPGLAGPRAR